MSNLPPTQFVGVATNATTTNNYQQRVHSATDWGTLVFPRYEAVFTNFAMPRINSQGLSAQAIRDLEELSQCEKLLAEVKTGQVWRAKGRI